MTDIDIDAIRQREQAATPGPWGVGNGTFVASELKRLDNGSIQYRYAVADLDEFAREESDYPNPVSPEADAEFIAHARTDVPALLAKVDELTAALAEVPPAWATFTADDMHGAGLETVAAEMDRDALATELAKVRAQLTAANRRADGLEADLRSANTANTAYANENARLRSQLADADVVIGSMRAAIDEADEAVAR